MSRAHPAQPVVAPTDEPVRALCARIAAAAAAAGAGGDGGRLGVVFSGDASSVVLLGLVVRAVDRSRVVALVDARAGSTLAERCGAVQAANGIGVPVFDLAGRALDEVVRTLELSVVAVADDAPRPDGAAEVFPVAVTGLDPAAVGLGAPAPAGSRQSEDVVQVEAAESELRRLGLEELRVRHHGELARVEAPYSDLVSVAAEPLRDEVLRAVRSAGFRVVALDLGALADPPRS